MKAQDKEEEELRRLLIESEILEGTLNTLRQRLSLIEASITESRMAAETLQGIKSEKKGAEVLVPIGGGSFIKARIEDNERVIVGIGADVSVEKTIDEAIKDFEDRLGDLEKTRQSVEQQFLQVSQRLEADRERLSEILKAREGETRPVRTP
ncbi:MAG: prefoldin subunit alpha [Candidatus Bathyarchaeia archaeon]